MIPNISALVELRTSEWPSTGVLPEKNNRFFRLHARPHACADLSKFTDPSLQATKLFSRRSLTHLLMTLVVTTASPQFLFLQSFILLYSSLCELHCGCTSVIFSTQSDPMYCIVSLFFRLMSRGIDVSIYSLVFV